MGIDQYVVIGGAAVSVLLTLVAFWYKIRVSLSDVEELEEHQEEIKKELLDVEHRLNNLENEVKTMKTTTELKMNHITQSVDAIQSAIGRIESYIYKGVK